MEIKLYSKHLFKKKKKKQLTYKLSVGDSIRAASIRSFWTSFRSLQISQYVTWFEPYCYYNNFNIRTFFCISRLGCHTVILLIYNLLNPVFNVFFY